MAKTYSNDSRERVINIYESGVSKKEIVDIFLTGVDTHQQMDKETQRNWKHLALQEDKIS